MNLVSRISEVITAIGVAVKGKQDKSINKVLSMDVTLNTTTLVPLSDFNVTLLPNKVYQIVAYIPFTHSTSGAVCNVGYTTPSDAISFLEVLTPMNTGNLAVYDYYSYLYSSNTPITDAKAGYTLLTNGDNNPCIVKGIIKTISGGTFSIKVASEDGTTVVIKQNATLILIPN